LRSDHGELVAPRGGSVNRCDYCAKLAAIENCEMLALDAMEGNAPEVLIVLGTRTATVDMDGFYRGHEKVRRALRRRWPTAEYAALLEFTTGYGDRSGGLRRPHWNLLWKGIPAAAADQAGEIAARVWCQHVDAEPHAQHASAVRDGVAVTKYLTNHFQKESQLPPANFTGQRFNCSRGYFTNATRATARARAKQSLALKRELWKHAQVLDDAHDVELAAQLSHRRNLATRWVLASDTGARLSASAVPVTSLTDRLRELIRTEPSCLRPASSATASSTKTSRSAADTGAGARRSTAGPTARAGPGQESSASAIPRGELPTSSGMWLPPPIASAPTP